MFSAGIEAAMTNGMPSKDQVARELVELHFRVEPYLQEVWRILSDDEASPTEPIKLIEVNVATVATGRVTPFAFGSTPDVPFPVVIAEVTPDELAAAKDDPRLLPPGWHFENAIRLTRPES